MTKKINQFTLFVFLLVFTVACGGNDKGENSKENNTEGNVTDHRSAAAHKNEVIELNKSADIYAIGGGIAKLTIKSITADFFPEGKTVLLSEDEEIIRFDLEISNENEKDFDFNYTSVRVNTPDKKNRMLAIIINKSNVDDMIESKKTLKKGDKMRGAMYFSFKKGIKKEDVSLFVKGYDDKMKEKNTEIFLKDE